MNKCPPPPPHPSGNKNCTFENWSTVSSLTPPPPPPHQKWSLARFSLYYVFFVQQGPNVGSGFSPIRWLNRWLSVTIASIQSLKKGSCTPRHFLKFSVMESTLLRINRLKEKCHLLWIKVASVLPVKIISPRRHRILLSVENNLRLFQEDTE